jgi:hypothetical protein
MSSKMGNHENLPSSEIATSSTASFQPDHAYWLATALLQLISFKRSALHVGSISVCCVVGFWKKRRAYSLLLCGLFRL